MWWFWKKLEPEVHEKLVIPKPRFTRFFEKSFFKKNNLNNVWSMGSWCHCFKFLDGTRLHWLNFEEISKVKPYKQLKFLVFHIFKWVFRFVFIWGNLTKANISCVKFESFSSIWHNCGTKLSQVVRSRIDVPI